MKKWKLVLMTAVTAVIAAGSIQMVHDHAAAVQAASDVPDERVLNIDTSVRVLPGARIAVVSKQTKGEFWTEIHDGMEAAVGDINKAYGYSKGDKIFMTFEGPDDEMNVSSQINTLDAVIAENPDVLCLCAGDMDSCLAQLEAAEENGIPVVVFDSTVAEDDLISAYRGTDNVMVGKIAAEKIAEATAGKGKVIVFSATEKSATVRSRVAGFLDELALYPEITLVNVVYQDQVEDLKTVMTEALEKDPDIVGVYCTNGDTADLFLDLEREGDTSIAVVGTDGTKKQLKAITEGRELGCVSQKAWQIGYDTILAAAALTTPVNLTRVERDVYLEPMWIDESNIEQPETESYIYN